MPKYLKLDTLSKLHESTYQTEGAAVSPTAKSLLFCWLMLRWCCIQKAENALHMVPSTCRDGARSTTSSANNKITITMLRNYNKCL